MGRLHHRDHVRTRRLWRPGAPHNLLAHPLLVLCPPLGEWLYERTSETVPTRYAERLGRDAGRGWPRRFHLLGDDHPFHDLGVCLRRAVRPGRLR